MLDPEGDDRKAFLRWVLTAVLPESTDAMVTQLDALTQGYSAAAFSSLRSDLKAIGPKTIEQVVAIVNDHIPPAIGLTRRYQTLQALINCTRRSLLPDPNVSDKDRQGWQLELNQLEAMGIG